MAEPGEYHVMVRRGDGSAEVDRIVGQLGGAQKAGLYRCYYVSRANQTVVMTTDKGSPIAAVLRDGGEWAEPAEAN